MTNDMHPALAYPAAPTMTLPELLLDRFEQQLTFATKYQTTPAATLADFRAFAKAYTDSHHPVGLRPTFGNYVVTMDNGDEFVISSAANTSVGPAGLNNLDSNNGAVQITGVRRADIKVIDYRYGSNGPLDKRATTPAAPLNSDVFNR